MSSRIVENEANVEAERRSLLPRAPTARRMDCASIFAAPRSYHGARTFSQADAQSPRGSASMS